MDRLDIEWSVINVFIVVVLIVGGIVIHELPIAHAAQNNIETNYYLFSDDNMTHTQKYDVALSICQSVYEDEIMKMWHHQEKIHGLKTMP